MSHPSEEDRLRVASELEFSNPPAELGTMVAGFMGGPATAGRPGVPIWQYPDLLKSHPEMSLEELEAVRSPLRLFSGDFTIISISELTTSVPGTPTYEIDFFDVVRLMELRHGFGALEWNEADRSYVETMPLADYRADVYGRWRQELEAKQQ